MTLISNIWRIGSKYVGKTSYGKLASRKTVRIVIESEVVHALRVVIFGKTINKLS